MTKLITISFSTAEPPAYAAGRSLCQHENINESNRVLFRSRHVHVRTTINLLLHHSSVASAACSSCTPRAYDVV